MGYIPRNTEKFAFALSPAERRMLEHLAMAERLPKAFVVRRLIRDAARDLYVTIKVADEPAKDLADAQAQAERETPGDD